ncbi:MAG: excinuclease ABC subunit UvrC [Clostridiales bacterium]|nr:excinuclease ABC subunit UvrC [Clostridiales bacterium]
MSDLARLRKKAMKLPLLPGVYLMKNSQGQIIYVGKAKALKNRVSQYFGSQNNHSLKVRKMVENVDDFDFIVTDSEFEALVLECSLIKLHTPKYNILLKDDKGYHYIKVTKGDWPVISAAKQVLDDGADYIGPYTSSFAVSNSVDEALKIFKLPQCGKVFPRDIGKGRPCLNYHISQCCAPCSGKVSCKEYNDAVNDALKFLKNGGGSDTVKRMETEMQEAAEALDFERAAKLRDRIASIKKMTEKQKVMANIHREQDVFAVVCEREKACMSVLRFTGGRLFDSEHFIIDRPEDLADARRELLQSFYSMRTNIPKNIVVDGDVEDSELLCEWLSETSGHKVTITVPLRGEQVQLVEMCRKNASENLFQSMGRKNRDSAALKELAELLGLQSPPDYIEAYDISHFAGSDNVAGMVVFKDGVPYRSAYKRFAIKGFEGQNDYKSMREVISRRFQRYLDGGDRGKGFDKLPDLILLDGGLGQVNAVKPVLQEMGLDIPLYGMVKDSRHRTRAISSSGGELELNAKHQAFVLVTKIQDEVHRFAITYHRTKHKKSTVSTTLTSIEGIGEARAKALLRHFKTMTAIRGAEVGEIAGVKGMNEKAARAVYAAFHPDDET